MTNLHGPGAGLRQEIPVPGPSDPRAADRIAGVQAAVMRHRHATCVVLSVLLGIIAVSEPLALHFSRHAAWLIPSAILSLACFANAVLALGRNAHVATHLLVLMVAGFVSLQVDMRTGMAWAFVLPPLILFLHPPFRGLAYVLVIVGVIAVTSMALHNLSDLDRADTLDFLGSFLAVTVVSALFSLDLRNMVNTVTSIAFRDPLTGLFQRDIFESMALNVLARAERTGAPVSVVAIDIDNMKTINDTWGHAAGDAAICLVSRALNATLRTSDVCARVGGDEFTVLFADTNGEQAAHVVRRVFDMVDHLATTAPWPPTYRMTLSAGIAPYRCQDKKRAFPSLLAKADTALMRAKRTEGHRIAVAEDSEWSRASEKMDVSG